MKLRPHVRAAKMIVALADVDRGDIPSSELMPSGNNS